MPWNSASSRDQPRPAAGDADWTREWLVDNEPSEQEAGRPRPRRGWWRWRLAPVVLAIAAFGAGISANALIFHAGHKGGSTKVVIGQQVVRPSPPSHPVSRPKTAPSTPTAAMSWGAPVRFDDPGYAPQSVACATSTFCVAVDNGGHAMLYQNFAWSSPFQVDGSTQINSVSCPSSGFCVAVDQAGNALVYKGGGWSRPQKVDKTATPELTSVSCASTSFCVAVDGGGNAVVFNGTAWSGPQAADDPASWGLTSRDVATIACPATNFCVGADPQGNAFYYTGSSWVPLTVISPAGGTPPNEYKNAVACSTTTQCLAAQNLGQIAAYNGTQWSAPVPVDPGNYVASLSCPSTTFCAAVDGLLPAGFSGGNDSGDVFLYNGTSWSPARNIDGTGILQSISCPSRNFCLAVDQGGSAIVGTSPG